MVPLPMILIVLKGHFSWFDTFLNVVLWKT